MMLHILPLLFALAGLVLYTVLAGADFGAGVWQLSASPTTGRRVREHAHHANAPVWEANHVWLIFVLVVLWTAYPIFLASVASTAFVPLGLALAGIVLRGLAYTLQNATGNPRDRIVIDNLFALASLLAPFALTTVLGAVASDRIPVGNAQGDPITCWINPTSMLCGVLGLAVSAYLAAIYLAADAIRFSSPPLVAAFRRRAIGAGLTTGAISLAGLSVLAHDAHRIYLGLTSGWGLAALVATVAGGVASMILILRNAFSAARLIAAAAVATLLLGWAAAQRPYLLPGLTPAQAASGTATLVALDVAVVAGGVLLAPGLALLFRLTLAGRFDESRPTDQSPIAAPLTPQRPRSAIWRTRFALASLAGGALFLVLADSGAVHVVAVLGLAAAAVAGFSAVDPTQVAADRQSPHEQRYFDGNSRRQ
jgi:cytochrome d ubiquinol oxidase subunit II